MTDPLRRLLLAAAAVLPAACASPGSAPTTPVPAPRIRVGDRWRYQVVDRLSGRWIDEPTWEAVEVGTEIRLAVRGRRGAAPIEERFTGSWAALQESAFDQMIRYDQPMPLLPEPIATGISASTSGTYTDPGAAKPLRWNQRLASGPWSTIEVPAGRFECLRVSRVIAFQHPDGFRSNSSRTDILWYAPQVNRWVQREWRGEYVSSGLGDNPAEGVTAIEDSRLLQLTAWLPTPAAG
jgi:hypothetical protein